MSFSTSGTEKITPNSNLNHETFPDLVNNFVFYHMQKELQSGAIMSKNKPPTYTNYPSLMSMYDEIIKNPKETKERGSRTVRCPVSMLYTCDAELHFTHGTADNKKIGYDRLHLIENIKDNAKAYMKDKDGFAASSEALHAMVRWIFDEDDNVIGFALAKDRGNLRSYIATVSNGGEDVDICVTLDFHNPDPKLTVDEMIAIEAETFTEDAVDRRGFTQKTKFGAGYIADREKFRRLKNWVDTKLEVDYANVINTERLRNGLEPYPFELSSLEKIEFNADGNPGGYLTKYGEKPIINATNLLKKIMIERGVVGKSPYELHISVINCFVKAFYFLTATPSDLGFKKGETMYVNALATEKEVHDILFWLYTQPKASRLGTLGFVNDIQDLRKKNEKDTTLIGMLEFMPEFLTELMETKGVKSKYTGHPCITKYIDRIREPHMRTEVQSRLSK